MRKLRTIGSNLVVGIKKQTKLVTILAVSVVVSVLGAALVSAAIPDANGKIHACYTTGVLGRVRIIDSPTQTCRNNETAISWDQSGGSAPAAPGGFVSSNLPNSKFRVASLPYRDLQNMNFTGSTWEASDLTGSNLVGSNLTNNTFKVMLNPSNYMSFIDADAHGVNFTGSYFEFNLHASGANFSGANFTNVTFEGGLDGAGVSATDFTNANFQNANFTGSIFIPYPGAPGFPPAWNNFKGGDFSGAQFVNANLNGVVFTGSNFTTATWSNTICPDGTNSNSHGNTCIGFGI